MYHFNLYKKKHILLCILLVTNFFILLPTIYADSNNNDYVNIQNTAKKNSDAGFMMAIINTVRKTLVSTEIKTVTEVETMTEVENITTYKSRNKTNHVSNIKTNIEKTIQIIVVNKNNYPAYSHTHIIPIKSILVPYKQIKTYDIPQFFKYKGNIHINTTHFQRKKQINNSTSNIFIGSFEPHRKYLTDGNNVHIKIITDINQCIVSVIVQSTNNDIIETYHSTDNNNPNLNTLSCSNHYLNIQYNSNTIVIKFKKTTIANIPYPNFTAKKMLFISAEEAFKVDIFHDNQNNRTNYKQQ